MASGASIPSNSSSEPHNHHLVLVLMWDRPGAMERVMALLRRRTTSVAALSFAPSEEPDLLRVTIALSGAHAGIEHVVHQLRKLADVRTAVATPVATAARGVVVRELALIRVACDFKTRREVVDLAQLFGAQAVDVTDTSLTLEISGDDNTIENLLRLLRPIGIREIARSGKVLLHHENEQDESAEAISADIQATG